MADSAVVNLELVLRRSEGGGQNQYLANLTLRQAGQGDKKSGFQPVTLDVESLSTKAGQEYITCLTSAVWAPPKLRDLFVEACTLSESIRGGVLRFCVYIEPGAPELHDLCWEMLADPRDDKKRLIAKSSKILFRLLSLGTGGSSGKPPTRSGLRALAAVANPADLNYFHLPSIDVAIEHGLAREGLKPIPVQFLPGTEAERCTLDRLFELASVSDVLFLACHGGYHPSDGAVLFLENEHGEHDRVQGERLYRKIFDLDPPPRLVVLASCQSAGNGGGKALRAIGPRLVEAGVPAVIAMQGQISYETMQKFLPALFRSLVKDGIIDQAVAAARHAIRDQYDWWVPVLYLNQPDGKLWDKDYKLSQQTQIAEWWEQSGYRINPFSWKYAGEIPKNLLDDLFVDHTQRDPVDDGLIAYPFLEQVAYSDQKELVLAYGSIGSGKTFYSWLCVKELDQPGGPRAVRIGNLVDALRDPAQVTTADLAYLVYRSLCEVLNISPEPIHSHQPDPIFKECARLCREHISDDPSQPAAYIFFDDFETLFNESKSFAEHNRQVLDALIEFIQTIERRYNANDPFAIRLFLPSELRDEIQAGLSQADQAGILSPLHELLWSGPACMSMIAARLKTFYKEESQEGELLLKLFSQDTFDGLNNLLKKHQPLSPRGVLNLCDQFIRFAVANRHPPREEIPIKIWEDFSKKISRATICPAKRVYPMAARLKSNE